MAQARPQLKPRVTTPDFPLEIHPASVVVVLVMLILFVADGVLMARHLTEIGAKGPAESVGMLWLVKTFVLAMFFTLPVPLVIGTVWGIAQLMNKDLPSGLYIRAAALASLPMSLLLIGSMSPAAMLVCKALIVLTVIGTKLLLDVPFKQALIYFLVYTPLVLMGIYITDVLVTPLKRNSERASQRQWAQREAEKKEREIRNSALAMSTETAAATPVVTDPFADPAPQAPASTEPSDETPAPTPATAPTAPPAAAANAVAAAPATKPTTPDARMAELRTQAAALRTRGRGGRISQQVYGRDLDPLLAELEALKAVRGNTPEWRAIDRDLRQQVNTRDRLPSDTPAAELFEPLTAPTTFPSVAAAPADPPRAQIASAWDYNLVLPERAEVDLRSTEDSPDGIAWSARKDQRFSGLRLKLIAKSDTRQQRPWIVPRGFTPAEASSLLIYKVGGDPTAPQQGQGNNRPSVGLIGGLAFTRIPINGPGQQPGQVEYVASVGDKWLIANVQFGGSPSEIIDFEPALHSLHPRAAEEPVLKPVRAETLVNRVAQPQVAAALKKMPDAEDALLERYEKLTDQQKPAAVSVLVEVATEKSIPLLETLQNGNTPQRNAIREALTRLNPTKYDKYSMAIADLKSNDPRKRGDAVSMLARDEQDAKRSDVTRALEAIDDQVKGREVGPYATAMAKWADARTAAKFRPMLDEKAQPPQREVAIAVLSAMKDRASIGPIAKLLAVDTGRASAALVSMGQMAEEETIKYVRQADPRVKVAAVKVLEKIGTQRSLAVLQSVKDGKNPAVDTAAQTAYDAVRARFDAQRAANAAEQEATTRPAPTVPPG